MKSDDILDCFANDPDFFREAISIFLTISTDYRKKLALAIESGNNVDALHWSHTWKGSAATMGASTLKKALASIELNCRNNRVADCQGLWSKVDAEFGRIMEQIPPIIENQHIDIPIVINILQN